MGTQSEVAASGQRSAISGGVGGGMGGSGSGTGADRIDAVAAAQGLQWHSLGTPACELRLEHTLPTGQSFRWRQTSPSEYIGVIGQRVVGTGLLPLPACMPAYMPACLPVCLYMGCSSSGLLPCCCCCCDHYRPAGAAAVATAAGACGPSLCSPPTSVHPPQVRMRQLDSDVQYSVVARGADAPPAGDAAALHDYFNLSHSLALLATGWRAADPHFTSVHSHFPGARVLRQDPLECLLCFVCSSNNHISRWA